MHFPFNFARNDEQFIDKVRTSKKRESDIARLEKTRARLSWLMWVIGVAFVVIFVIRCVSAPLTLQTLSSSIKELLFTPSLMFFLFALVDIQIKTLKLAQRYEQE